MLTAERDQTVLAGEIIEMREKMFPTHPPVDSNVKYGARRRGRRRIYRPISDTCPCPPVSATLGQLRQHRPVEHRRRLHLIDKTLAEQSRTATASTASSNTIPNCAMPKKPK